jgi:pyridoxine 4-dehydrogenase
MSAKVLDYMSGLFENSVFNKIKLGDISLNRIGLGTNRVTNTPDVQMFLQAAVDIGINFIDTAHVYSGGDSEVTIGDALSPFKDSLVVATKGGMGDGGNGNNVEEFLRSNLEESLVRLKTGCITLYQIHRLDANVPMKQTMELLSKFQAGKKIKYIGLSEVSLEQLEEARRYADIVSVQNQYSLTYREHEDVLDYCTANGIIFIPWFPLRDVNGEAVLRAKLEPIAKKYQATPQILILAWLLKKSPLILPIPGTLSIDHLKNNISASGINIDDEDLQILTNWK